MPISGHFSGLGWLSTRTSGPIRNGLSLYLDAGNTTSYPRSGTSWSDLSRKSNTSTLVNGPTYSATNRGVITTDGANDYIDLGTSRIYITTTTPFTWQLWLKPSFRASGVGGPWHRLCALRSTGGSTLGLSHARELANGYTGLYIAATTGWLQASTSYIPPNNQWGMYTLTYNGNGSTNKSNFQIYYNTTAISWSTAVPSVPAASADCNVLATRSNTAGDTSQALAASYGVVMIYNKMLSASEVMYNYNSLRSRYGI